MFKPINCDIFVRWKTTNVYSSTGYSLAREKCIHFDHHGDEFWTICYCWFNEYIRLLTINYQVRLCPQPRVLFTCTFYCIWKQTIFLTSFKFKKRHVNCSNQYLLTMTGRSFMFDIKRKFKFIHKLFKRLP